MRFKKKEQKQNALTFLTIIRNYWVGCYHCAIASVWGCSCYVITGFVNKSIQQWPLYQVHTWTWILVQSKYCTRLGWWWWWQLQKETMLAWAWLPEYLWGSVRLYCLQGTPKWIRSDLISYRALNEPIIVKHTWNSWQSANTMFTAWANAKIHPCTLCRFWVRKGSNYMRQFTKLVSCWLLQCIYHINRNVGLSPHCLSLVLVIQY